MEVFTLGAIAPIVAGTLSGAGIEKVTVTSVVASGKDAARGSLFVAIPGVKFDGHQYIDQAFSNGAQAAVVTNQELLNGRPGIIVRDSRLALSRLSALFAGHPSARMKVVGITGTNGKTTTNWLIYHALNSLSCPCVRLGTLGVMTEQGYSRPDTLTTPDSLEIHRSLQTALKLGVKSCVMEVSSHSLDQKRVDDVQFDVGVFTNLTRDHLDYHKEMDSYFLAKKRLFELLSSGKKKTRAAVINLDSPEGMKLRSGLSGLGLADFSFGRAEGASFRITRFSQNTSGSVLEIEYSGVLFKINSAFIGEHNAENLAGAFASLVALGYEPGRAAAALEAVPQVPGRLESVGNPDISIYVDYAHTPDALERAALCLKPVTRGRLWIIFGCGGDRDRGKRPQMARIASRLGNVVVVTSDNPRTEEPASIISEILNCPEGAAIQKSGIVEVDRRLAIEKTVLSAGKGDVILLAGKGHEDYQIIGTVKHHFSDQEEARKALEKRAKQGEKI